MDLYHEAVEDALEAEEADQEKSLKRVFKLDQFIQHNAFLCMKPTGRQVKLQQELLTLRKYEYFSRYADYWNRELTSLKSAAVRIKSDNFAEFNR